MGSIRRAVIDLLGKLFLRKQVDSSQFKMPIIKRISHIHIIMNEVLRNHS